MQITRTTPNFTGKCINVPKNLNTGRKYLYNEMQDIIKTHKVPAIIGNDGIKIELPSDHKEGFNRLVDTLNQTGIKFNKIV